MTPSSTLAGMTCTKALSEPLAEGAIPAFMNQRNEALRLPYLLEYYRRLGVARFYVVDNASDDGSRDFLAAQPDVCLYETSESFVGNRCGLNWLEALRNRYGTDRWCLTIDADELFVYPMCEQMPLSGLSTYLDSIGAEAMLALMIDCYPEGPLREARYTAGTPFQNASPYFDRKGYYLSPDPKTGLVGAYGGPRYRAFYAEGAEGRGPVLRKVPFVKWVRGACYTSVNHAVGRMQFADATGAVLHYKFLNAFDRETDAAVAHGDRSHANFYTPAQKVMQATPDLSLHNSSISERYTDSLQLCRLGLMQIDRELHHFTVRWTRKQAKTAGLAQPSPQSESAYQEARVISRRRKAQRKLSFPNFVDQWGPLSNMWRGG